jgi:hypothetical protein
MSNPDDRAYMENKLDCAPGVVGELGALQYVERDWIKGSLTRRTVHF